MQSERHEYHAQEAQEALRTLRVDRQEGLSTDEVKARRERYGFNRLRKFHRRSALRIFLQQFESVVIIILLLAAIAALATSRWPEAIALFAVAGVNTFIGFVSEWRAVRSMEALRAMTRTHTRVRRHGREEEVRADALVPGDLVLLTAEDLVPADVRLVHAQNFQTNEAALTGESVPVRKSVEPVATDAPLAERTCMLYKGTTVVEGSGEGVVVATGMATELGHISAMAEEAKAKETPLQEKLDRLGRRMAWITICIAAVVAVIGLVRGRSTVLMIETSIALGVAAIPEGLPIVATIGLARGMWLMARRHALINRLPAVETLGATTVIFTDKTGTLTENRMILDRIVTPLGDHEIRLRRHEAECELDDSSRQSLEGDAVAHRAVEIGVLCNNAQRADGKSGAKGDPTEIALLEAGAAWGLNRDELLGRSPEVREEPFDPAIMLMATFHRQDDAIQIAVKGAPRAVLERCNQIAAKESARELSEEDQRHWLQRAEDLASEGLRLLAVADRVAQDADGDPYDQLRFVGLVGLLDPPRRDVSRAIEECKSAGMRAVMVTGDQPSTGQAIGRQVGLVHDDDPPPMHGSELEHPDRLSSEDRDRVLRTTVFARVSPEQKLNLVTLFQEEGQVVAMTGDGVNDAPALKKADIGIAMGRRGTDAARQAADMVLQDDNFATIVAAVRQGRIIFGDIRKSVMFMLCTNFAEILSVAIASVLNVPIPLHPLQILYLNVLTDVFPALALGVGKGTAEIMRQPPRAAGEAVLTRHHWTAIGLWSGVIGVCVLAALAVGLMALGLSETQAVTVSFLTLGFGKLWFVLNLREGGAKVYDNDVVRNPWVWASVVFCAALLMLAVYWPPLATVLRTADPGVAGWCTILGLSLMPALLGLIAPGVRFHAAQTQPQPQ